MSFKNYTGREQHYLYACFKIALKSFASRVHLTVYDYIGIKFIFIYTYLYYKRCDDCENVNNFTRTAPVPGLEI